MSTHPYIPLYVDDYDAATAHLTPAEDGVYLRLLRLCWRTPGCSLPNDHAWIARKIRLSSADFETVAKPVLDEFFQVSRGRLIQRRLKAEYDDISRKKMARVKAGKAGGSAKAQKAKENASSNASVLPPDTRAFPEPEPYPDKQEPPVVPQGTEAFELEAEQPPAPDDVRTAFDEWNALAGRIGLPTAKVLSDDRRRAISGRLKVGGLDLWRLALKNVEASAFLRGQRTGSNGQPFKADLAFVCQAKSFSKLIDGSYGADASRSRVPDDEHARIRRELEALL